MTKTSEKRDLYAEVTDSIVRSLETAQASGQMPWTMVENGAAFPRNLVSKKYYRGVNVWLLWGAAMDNGYTSGVWATYKQWQSKGAQVRKGEKSTMVVLWKPFDRKATAKDVAEGRADEVGKKIKGLLLRNYNVFAAEQVDGYEVPTVELTDIERNAAAEKFFENVGADVRFGGNVAAYSPSGDYILMPHAAQFADAEHFYGVLAHEHTHWTGHKARCDRGDGMTSRFGSEAYAMEELVAELGSAFIVASLGFHAQMRDDHASYIKSWIKVLKNDNRAIFTASSKAQQAADFLFAAQDVAVDDSDDDTVTGPRVDFDAWAA